jgi:hypothetical protein
MSSPNIDNPSQEAQELDLSDDGNVLQEIDDQMNDGFADVPYRPDTVDYEQDENEKTEEQRKRKPKKPKRKSKKGPGRKAQRLTTFQEIWQFWTKTLWKKLGKKLGIIGGQQRQKSNQQVAKDINDYEKAQKQDQAAESAPSESADLEEVASRTPPRAEEWDNALHEENSQDQSDQLSEEFKSLQSQADKIKQTYENYLNGDISKEDAGQELSEAFASIDETVNELNDQIQEKSENPESDNQKIQEILAGAHADVASSTRRHFEQSQTGNDSDVSADPQVLRRSAGAMDNMFSDLERGLPEMEGADLSFMNRDSEHRISNSLTQSQDQNQEVELNDQNEPEVTSKKSESRENHSLTDNNIAPDFSEEEITEEEDLSEEQDEKERMAPGFDPEMN